MPIYEYECTSCQHRLEKIQKMSDSKLVDCPECGKPDLKKLVSAVAFRLKGSGWYETDFKTGSKKNVSGADTGSSEANGSSDSSSTDASSAASKNKSADKDTKSKPAATDS
jgi:putative FmdB family regulatory protein